MLQPRFQFLFRARHALFPVLGLAHARLSLPPSLCLRSRHQPLTPPFLLRARAEQFGQFSIFKLSVFLFLHCLFFPCTLIFFLLSGSVLNKQVKIQTSEGAAVFLAFIFVLYFYIMQSFLRLFLAFIALFFLRYFNRLLLK